MGWLEDLGSSISDATGGLSTPDLINDWTNGDAKKNKPSNMSKTELFNKLQNNPNLYHTDPEFKKQIDDMGGNYQNSQGWADLNYSTYLAESLKNGAQADELMGREDFMSRGGGDGSAGYTAVVAPQLEKYKSRNKIQKLRDEAKTIGEEYLTKFKDERKGRRGELAKLLTEQSSNAFTENQPGILEDLSARGLLHSSGTGDALAKERARLAKLESLGLQGQDLADLDAEQGLSSAIMNRTLGYGDAELERGFSLDDIRMANEDSLQAAMKQAEAAKQNSTNELIGNIVGIGATLATGGLAAPLMAGNAASNASKVLQKKKTAGAGGLNFTNV